jgi:GNAT superfamily N-acetyltransferase
MMRLPGTGSIVEVWASTADPKPCVGSPEPTVGSYVVSGWPADVADVLSVAGATGLTATEVGHRLQGGSDAVVLTIANEPASTGWVSLEPTWIAESGLWIAPSPGEFYIWDCATRPQYRGQGLYPRLLRRIISDRYRQGDRLAWIGVSWNNWRSLDGIVEAGFRPIAAIVTWQVGPFVVRNVVNDAAASPELLAALDRALGDQTRGGTSRRARAMSSGPVREKAGASADADHR